MPKTAKPISTSSSQVIRKRTAAAPAPQHVLEDLPRKIRHLGGVIHHVQSFDFEIKEESSPEARLVAKTIKDLLQQFGRLQNLVFATPVKPGDTNLLRARAEIAQFWCAEEIAHYCPGDNSEAALLGGLISGIFSFCEVEKRVAQQTS